MAPRVNGQQFVADDTTLRGPVQQFTTRNRVITDATVLDTEPKRSFDAELTIALLDSR